MCSKILISLFQVKAYLIFFKKKKFNITKPSKIPHFLYRVTCKPRYTLPYYHIFLLWKQKKLNLCSFFSIFFILPMNKIYFVLFYINFPSIFHKYVNLYIKRYFMHVCVFFFCGGNLESITDIYTAESSEI